MNFSTARTLVAALARRLRRRSGPSGLPEITLVGNPFESIGRSEHIRTIWRALRAADVRASVYDVYGHKPEASVLAELGQYQVREIASGIRIFHLNGSELESVLDAIEARQPEFLRKGYNVAAPAWELPRYPAVWAKQLDRFDEIWAPTSFVENALRPAVSVPVVRVSNACEPHIAAPLDRSYFGIPEGRFAILYLFDVRSFVSRKNPWAAIDAFSRLLAARPTCAAVLVLKLNYGEREPRAGAAIRERIASLRDRVMLIDATLTNNETKNLIRCCDCFLSLHRSEGFGRGPAEAMFFGAPVVATGWSGNMDYMSEKTAFPVRYALRPVLEGEYLHYENQVWAEPDVAHAAQILVQIVDDPALGRSRGKRARRHMRRSYSDAVLGAVYRRQLERIARTQLAGRVSR